MNNIRFSTKKLAVSGVLAAIYVVITLLLRPISYGQIQVRVAEALAMLPVFGTTPVPGLFVGCLIANFLGGANGVNLVDTIFGSLTTLVAACLTYALRRRPLVAGLPPVALNAVVVGLTLHYTAGLPLLITMLWVGLGQAIAVYGLGLPLMHAIKKLPRNPFE